MVALTRSHVYLVHLLSSLGRTAACCSSGCCGSSSWQPRQVRVALPRADLASNHLQGDPHPRPVAWLGQSGGGQHLLLRADRAEQAGARRHGLEFGLYPWHGHLKDAVKGTKGMLTALGEWHHAVQDVREADLTNLATTQLQINQTMRQRALAGVNQPHQLPAQTVLHILDEGLPLCFFGARRVFSLISLAGEMRRNTYEFLVEPNLPLGVPMFFSLQARQVCAQIALHVASAV
ncbi:unnamed protein product [Effrenium voratum]|nr:unnamed protein product [Effrenium voratum]